MENSFVLRQRYFFRNIAAAAPLATPNKIRQVFNHLLVALRKATKEVLTNEYI